MTHAAQSALIDVFSSNAAQYDTGVEFFRPLAAKLVDGAGVAEGQDVLDVGCGRGAVLFQAAERVGPSGTVTGIDLADGMVEATAADARGLDNVAVRRMDGLAPEFAPASFDRILGSMSIIMIPDLLSAFGNYHALLRENGVLAFTSPTFGAKPTEWRVGPFDMRRILEDTMPGGLSADLQEMLDTFDSLQADSLLGELRAAGFPEPSAQYTSVTVHGASGTDLVAWSFSHGMRVLWEAIPEPRRSEYARELADRIDAEYAGEPSFEFPATVYRATK